MAMIEAMDIAFGRSQGYGLTVDTPKGYSVHARQVLDTKCTAFGCKRTSRERQRERERRERERERRERERVGRERVERVREWR